MIINLKIKFIFFTVLSLNATLSFSQVTNQDIMNRLDEIEDQQHFNYFLNQIKKSSGVNNSSSSKNKSELFYLGNSGSKNFYIIKSTIKKDNDFNGISYLTLVNSNVPQYVNDITYFSALVGGIIFCELPRIRIITRTYYSEENLNGKEVLINDKNLMIREDSIKSDPIFGSAKKYLCR